MNTKNLKPFDLQVALNGEAVMLRGGGKALVRYRETELPVADGYSLWGVICGNRSHSSSRWCEDGSYYVGGRESALDIVGMWPKTRVINGFEVPAPETEELRQGVMYCISVPTNKGFYCECEWVGDLEFDFLLLERGLVFLTKEDAIANAKAMLGIDPYKEAEE